MTQPDKTATFVKDLEGFSGHASLYKLSDKLDGFEYVVISAVSNIIIGIETYIFGSDSDGKIESWSELDGSFKGDLDHEKALNYAGYSIVEAA